MINIQHFKQVIFSKDSEQIIKEAKEVYKYLLFKDNRVDLYNEIFSTLDYSLILEIPILYILYCKLLKYNKKISKLEYVLNDINKLDLSNQSESEKLFFESNILLCESYLYKNKKNCVEFSLEKLYKSLEKTETNDYILLFEIYYELGSIYLSLFRISDSLLYFKKSKYYILDEYITANIIILRLKLNISNALLMKNKLSDYSQELKKIELFIQKSDLDQSYLIFYYDSLISLFFYKNNKKLLIDTSNKAILLFDQCLNLSSFMPYIRISIYLILMNELEQSKILISKIEEKFKLLEPPPKIRFFLYALNIIFYYKTNNINMSKIWVDELGKLFELNYENEYSIAIFYANFLLENNNITKAEEINFSISDFISSSDSDILKLQLDLLNIVIEYKKGYKNKAILNLKEKLFLAQKEWNVGIFLNSNTILLNMINEIYNESLNKKNILDSNFLKEIISYSNEKFDFNNYLTEKEIEVLKLVEQKNSNKEIANILFLSVNTIKTHLKNITKKLNVNTKKNAVIKAKEFLLI